MLVQSSFAVDPLLLVFTVAALALIYSNEYAPRVRRLVVGVAVVVLLVSGAQLAAAMVPDYDICKDMEWWQRLLFPMCW